MNLLQPSSVLDMDTCQHKANQYLSDHKRVIYSNTDLIVRTFPPQVLQKWRREGRKEDPDFQPEMATAIWVINVIYIICFLTVHIVNASYTEAMVIEEFI